MPKKFTRPEMLSILESRILLSKKKMEEEKSNVWDKCRALFEGDHFKHDTNVANKGKLRQVNLIWSSIRTKLAALYFRNPEFSLKPKKPEFEGPVQQLNEAILNYWVEKAMLKPIARSCVQASFTDLGILTWGCDTKFKERGGSNQNQNLLNPGLSALPQMIPSKESFYFKRILPEHFFPDHSTGEQLFEKLPGFATMERMRLEEVAERFNISESALEFTDSEENLENLERYYTESGRDFPEDALRDQKRVAVYRYYDKEKGKLFVFSKGLHDFLDISDIDGDPPYACLKFCERCKGFYPIPEIILLADPQRLIEIGMTMLDEHMRRSARKQQAPKGLLDEDAKSALEDPTAGILVELAGQGTIQPIDFGNPDTSIFSNISLLEGFFNQISGMATSARGGDAQKLTATAEAIADKHSMNRSSDHMALVADFMQKAGNGFLNCLQQNLTLPDVISITDQQGALTWMSYMPTLDIQGDFDCQVMVGDTAPKDDVLERAQWLECLATLQSNPLILMSPLLIEETLKRFNIDSPRLRDEMVKLGQVMMMQQQAASMGAGGSVPSSQGNTAGANLKVGKG